MLTLIEKDRGMHNDDAPTYIEETVTALYCGKPMTTELSPDLEFIDPLVRVHNGPPTLRMFERLNRLFPHTEIRKFELRQMNATTGDYVFDLEVHYKRTPSHRGQRMRSTLHVKENGRAVTYLREDWNQPLNLNAESLVFLHPLRRVLGKLCGL